MGLLHLVGWKINSMKSSLSGLLSVRRPIELVVLNCCVTETNDTPCASKSSTQRVSDRRAKAGHAIGIGEDNNEIINPMRLGLPAGHRRPANPI